jgi:predicted transcriptional regulator
MNETRKSSEGIRKTRLMYRCNLSFRQLKIYVRLLREKGFLRSTVLESEKVGAHGDIGKVEVYHITEEGLSCLKAYDELRHRLREEFLPR